MGAAEFFTVSSGRNANEAFRNAVQDAQYEHGHGGYTGTIAEKGSFVMIDLPEGKKPIDYAYEMLDDERVDNKWGPAGCIALADGRYLFFGWASE